MTIPERERAMLRALNELAADDEFAAVMAVAGAGDKVVAYLRRRGLEETEAQLLALAHAVGAHHALRQTGRALDHALSRARKGGKR